VKNISEQDIKFREITFIEIISFLKKNNIHFFIWGGALLGFRRENNFIKWDWDVEIGFYQKELTNNWSKIISFMKKNNFNIIQENKIDLKLEVNKYTSENITKFTLVGWIFDIFTQNYIRNNINIPKKFLKNMELIKFKEDYYNCPGPVDEFLTHMYGDWQTPKKTKNKSEYLNQKFLNQNYWRFYRKYEKLKLIFGSKFK